MIYSQTGHKSYQTDTRSYLDQTVDTDSIERLCDVIRYHEYRYSGLNDPMIADYEHSSRTTSSTKVIDIPAVATVTGGIRYDSTLYLLIATEQAVSIAGVTLPATQYVSTYLVQFSDDLEVMDWIPYTSDTAHIVAHLVEFQKDCTPIVAGKLSTKDNFLSISGGPFDCSWIGTRDFGCKELEPYSYDGQIDLASPIEVYPNPFSSDIEIGGLDLGTFSYQLELYDMTGILVLTKVVTSANHNIPASVPAGLVYYRIIRQDGIVYDGKILKI